MPADASTVSSARTAGTESRHGEDGGGRPERLVAATGTSRSVPGASQTTQTRPRSCFFVTPRQRSRAQRDREARRSRRVARYEAVVGLHRQGASLRTIGQAVGLSRATARRFVRAGTFPERAPSSQRPTSLTPYEPYLRARWTAGC